MSIRLFAMVFALSLPAASPAQAMTDEKKAPQVAGEDPNEKVCENITAIGSRLSKKRVCATRAEWAEKRKLDREAIDQAQRAANGPCQTTNTHTGAAAC